MRKSRLVFLLCAFGAIAAALTWQALTPGGLAQEQESREWDPRVDLPESVEGKPQVWLEAMFIQIDTVDLDKARSSLKNSLDPQTGKIILTGDEKAELLTALKDRPSFEILGSASLITNRGDQALMQMVEEVRYPTEYTAERSEKATEDEKAVEGGEPVVVPETFETRNVGVCLEATTAVTSDGKSVALWISPEVSLPAGYMTYGSKLFSQPVFTAWGLTTTLVIEDGKTIVLTGVPTKNFEQSYLLNPQQAEGLKGKKSALLLISAKIVDPGKKQ